MNVGGSIIGEGAIEIAGKVQGEVKCLSVKLEKGAVVNGDITAEKIEIHGTVAGNVTAKTIICGSEAKIDGDITHQRIHIEDGAHINGNCRKFIVENETANETIIEPAVQADNENNSETDVTEAENTEEKHVLVDA